ncbi:MAG: hypothetical protein O6837_08160 [Deltaproteobacteria bacterium]|nr:hypothetical protein [candidate division NC10 bacterium]MCZ6548075.1 hypothetical protein [Deltaproteobacteria bacterium]
MRCEHCGTQFKPRHPRGRYCSDHCRTVAWQKRRNRELMAALDEAERALHKVRLIIWGEAEGKKLKTHKGSVAQ